VTQRGLAGTKFKPIARAPSFTLSVASATRVMPQILT
jgi:hypothetical protein